MSESNSETDKNRKTLLTSPKKTGSPIYSGIFWVPLTIIENFIVDRRQVHRWASSGLPLTLIKFTVDPHSRRKVLSGRKESGRGGGRASYRDGIGSGATLPPPSPVGGANLAVGHRLAPSNVHDFNTHSVSVQHAIVRATRLPWVSLQWSRAFIYSVASSRFLEIVQVC